MTDTVYYCYAVTRPFDREVLPSLRGIGGAPVNAVAHGDLVALTSPVSAEEFTEAGLQERLEDLDWLADVARAHHAVVDEVARHAAIVPLRLATVYREQARVTEVLRSDEQRLSEALDRLEGRFEWGVKVFAPQQRQQEPARAEQSSAASGRDYLRRRLDQRNSREASLQKAEESAAAVDAELADLAEARHRHRVLSSELTGTRDQNVLNVAYLVPVDDQERFLRRFAELEEEHPGCSLQLSGPWAPYSFMPDQVEVAESGE
ncbi:GvpL/GvpF family gas vesicle protein [Saccharopolyspora rhizosphaerae]|uniref:GvpL/GvpF family gas vesicle protein n=1 Tax=Saccharopolyspora rhizosphaerae TaxID=2492662 RepID=A0A426K024_9PSEU|nr:GvpL/GvpF family gas vesicle protein [Saccharopolyspora rhizosphaerae]RRO18718.1 GvpL/GvpF family gas vesicle protein [Saccharopolyspora rhizosphaerae]